MSAGSGAQIYVGASAVAPTDETSGMALRDSVPLILAKTDRLWGRSVGADASVQLQPNISDISFSQLDLIMGRVPGASQVSMGGVGVTVADTLVTVEPVPTVIPPLAGLAVSIASTSAADVGITIRVWALGPNATYLAPFDVVLNGVTPVPLGVLSRINGIARASGDIVGVVSAVNGASVYAVIEAGETRSRTARYSVPAGYRLAIQSVAGSMIGYGDDSIALSLQSKPAASTGFGNVFSAATWVIGASTFQIDCLCLCAGEGPIDVRLACKSTIGDITLSASMTGVLINTTVNP
jgi:hypothetical protein